jgi:hypothetical protein
MPSPLNAPATAGAGLDLARIDPHLPGLVRVLDRLAPGVLVPEPHDYARLLTGGRAWPADRLALHPGRPRRCHDNAARLWARDPARWVIVTGLARTDLSGGAIWHHHSWLHDQATGQLTETTHARTHYFGVPLGPEDTRAFVQALTRRR